MSQIDQPDYTYEFDGISDRLTNSPLRIHNHRDGLQRDILVAVDDSDFLDIRGRQVPSHIADLIDLAVAIYEADRWSKRREDEPCKILVRLPVRHPEVFRSAEMHELLGNLLYWYTGDVWAFEFIQFDKQRRFAELQLPLWVAPYHDVPVKVSLWSGGADGLAGLCNQKHQKAAERFLLFGAGGNFTVRGVQKQVANALKERFPSWDISLTLLAIYQKRTRPAGLGIDRQQRARGLVFMLLGSAFALLENQYALHIYENGYGALNLPFRASEVGLDHSRAVHPLSLLYLSRFVSQVLGENFRFENPFLFSTKAEMCRVLEELSVVDIASLTISCDRRHRKQTTECGRCSSCLLRRQAFVAAGLDDQTRYLTQIERGEALNRLLEKSHLPAMLFQVNQLRLQLAKPNAWDVLARQHPTLLADLIAPYSSEYGMAQEELKRRILSLLQAFTDEWTVPEVRELFDTEMDAIKRVPRHTKMALVLSS